MTIPRALAHRIVKSWTRKRGFPADDTEIKELVDAVQKYSLSEQHARDIRASLEDADYCPEIPTIRRVAFSTRPDTRRKSDGCPMCGGTGWQEIGVERKRIADCDHAPTATAVVPCSCRAVQQVLTGVSSDPGGGV